MNQFALKLKVVFCLGMRLDYEELLDIIDMYTLPVYFAVNWAVLCVHSGLELSALFFLKSLIITFIEFRHNF